MCSSSSFFFSLFRYRFFLLYFQLFPANSSTVSFFISFFQFISSFGLCLHAHLEVCSVCLCVPAFYSSIATMRLFTRFIQYFFLLPSIVFYLPFSFNYLSLSLFLCVCLSVCVCHCVTLNY